MSVFEITIQHKVANTWPVLARYEPGAGALELQSRGRLELDPKALVSLLPSEKAYGLQLGKVLFREDVRHAFVRAVGMGGKQNEPLRVVLIIESSDLRGLHWEQLHAPLDRAWDYLLLNQATPFSLYPPSQVSRPFPSIGRRDLRALVLVAGPEELAGDYGLASFDVAATAESVQQALGASPYRCPARSRSSSPGRSTTSPGPAPGLGRAGSSNCPSKRRPAPRKVGASTSGATWVPSMTCTSTRLARGKVFCWYAARDRAMLCARSHSGKRSCQRTTVSCAANRSTTSPL